MSEDAARASLARLLLDVQGQPGRHNLAQRQPAALFDAMPQVLLWAAGRQLGPAAQALACAEDDLQHAAMWLVRQSCLRTGADALTVLGLAPGFTRASLREHYRLLIRLTHPDFMAAHQGEAPWPDDAAQRINTANDALLRRLGSAEVDPGEPEPPTPPAPTAPATPPTQSYRHVPPTPRAPRTPPASAPLSAPAAWHWDSISPRLKMAAAACGALVCVLALVWGNGDTGGSRLVARAPSVPEAPRVAEPEPVQTPGLRKEAAVPAPTVVPRMAPAASATAPAPTERAIAASSTRDAVLRWWEAPAQPARTSPPVDVQPATLADTPTPEPAPLMEVRTATEEKPEPQAQLDTPAQMQAATPAPAPTRLAMLDVQVTMTNLVAYLGAGRTNDVLALIAGSGGNRREFESRWHQWLGGSQVQGMGVVTMQAQARGHQLWVDGTVELQVRTQQGQTDRRYLPFRAAFEGEPSQASLVSLTLRQVQP